MDTENNRKKINIMLTGYNGRMGRAIIEATEKSDLFSVIVGIDINPAPINLAFPVFLQPSDFTGKVDVIIDFTHHSAIDSLLEYAKKISAPLVVATTGHNDKELELINEAAKEIAIFKSANMSVGVNLIIELAKKAAALLQGDFDIEIIEKHHNQKLDAPSGTALMIADGISSVLDEKPEYIYNRQPVKKVRGKNEIGLHAVRGGTIIGEHEVIFAGNNESITISHSAQSREMFANGALSAAKFICGKPAGLYTMKSLIGEI